MKGQDLLVMLKLAAQADAHWKYASLAKELSMSPSEVHAAVARCEKAGLYNPHTRLPKKDALKEFLVHGLRYVFPAVPGPLIEGIPTSFAAPPLNKKFRFEPTQAPVMPLVDGTSRGPEITPIYRSAPIAARRDERLYQLLALVDALRSGRNRERKLAQEFLTDMLAS